MSRELDRFMSELNFQKLLGVMSIAAGAAMILFVFGSSAKKALSDLFQDSSDLVYTTAATKPRQAIPRPMVKDVVPLPQPSFIQTADRVAKNVRFESTNEAPLPTFRRVPAMPKASKLKVVAEPTGQKLAEPLRQERPLKGPEDKNFGFSADVSDWPEISPGKTDDLSLPELPGIEESRTSSKPPVDDLSDDLTLSQKTNQSAGETQSLATAHVARAKNPSLVAPAVFESSTQKDRPVRIHVDKQVRKANWAEIEVEPLVKSRSPLRSLRQPMLVRLRANAEVESRAQERIRYGESLARRRSFYAAREEFTLALLLIANSHTSETNAADYPDRFAQALMALDEIGDFVSSRNSDTVFQQRVLSHKTQLISPEDIGSTPPLKALDLYCGFAQSQIEQAVGHSVAGSRALHALGKLESKLTESNSKKGGLGRTKALVFFRAALNVNSGNSVCANDLGVMLFRMGRFNEAEEAFKVSLASSPSQLGWSNLASVHNRRAAATQNSDERNQQLWLANLAAKEAQKYSGVSSDNRFADNQWASTSDFQNNAAFPDTTLQQVSGEAGNSPQNEGTPRSASLIQKVKGWY